MTNRETLRSLAEQVEALGEGDPVIDGAIHALTHPEDFDGDAAYYATCPRVNRADLNYLRDLGVRRYTASIDAAMSLMPAGYRVMLSEWDDEAHLRPRGPWQAVLSIAGSGMCGFDGASKTRCEHAATPALALTAASLRAIGEGL